MARARARARASAGAGASVGAGAGATAGAGAGARARASAGAGASVGAGAGATRGGGGRGEGEGERGGRGERGGEGEGEGRRARGEREGEREGEGERGGRGGGSRVVVGVDLDGQSLGFARHNAAVCAPGARAGFVRADVTQFPVGAFDAVFMDPARRDAGGRLRTGEYRPPLRWCLDLAGVTPRTCIKAAPGLRRDLVPPGWETEFVAVGRELKEALLWSPALASGDTATRATVLTAAGGEAVTHTLTEAAQDDPAAVPVRPPGAYLIDPNPAVTRAGLVAELARRTGTWQIDPMIAFLSGDEPVTTPFGRTLRVIESAPWHEKRFARRLRELGIGAADIRRRGLAGDVADIHRRLGLRGPGAATIVLTRMNDRPWGMICAPLPPDSAGLARPELAAEAGHAGPGRVPGAVQHRRRPVTPI